MAQEVTSYLFPQPTMLWKYSLNAYSGFIDAEPTIAEARKALIGKLEPAEPSPHTLMDLGKRVFGINTKT